MLFYVELTSTCGLIPSGFQAGEALGFDDAMQVLRISCHKPVSKADWCGILSYLQRRPSDAVSGIGHDSDMVW